LHRHDPFYVAESIDKIAVVILCVGAVWLMRPTNLRGISATSASPHPYCQQLHSHWWASSPMLIGFALTRSLTPHIQILPLLFLTVFSPLVEEIEFRGFGVRNLQRGTGWPFWRQSGRRHCYSDWAISNRAKLGKKWPGCSFCLGPEELSSLGWFTDGRICG